MLNWLARYAPAGAMLLEDGRATGSILDVGCGPHGLACAHPGVPFVGLDVTFPHRVAASMVGIEAPPGELPFVDGAFDTVVSLDTLEHVPRPDRAGFVAELARVAARRVLLACPSDEGAPLDALVRERFVAAHGQVPEWLAEHDQHVLPSRAEIEGFVTAVPGFRARPWPMVNGLLSALLPWADLFEFSRLSAAEAAQRRAEWVRLLEQADFGPSFRAGWVLERAEERVPAIGIDDLEGDLAGALRCLACGGSHAWQGGAPVCTRCGRPAERAPSHAWRLAAEAAPSAPEPVAPPAPEPVAPPAPEPTADRPEPGRSLLLTPDWERPESWLPALAAYVAGARPDDDLTLFVDGRCDLGLDVAAELMATACGHLAGEAVFADVAIIAPGDAPPANATPVATAAGVRAALGLPDEVRETWSDERLLAHARWGKALADGVRTLAQLRRAEAVPAPWDEPAPLVSVHVPGGPGVESAVASVLGGSYGNVEVLVVGGADAQAAAAAIRDPRVRAVRAAEGASRWAAANAALDAARGAWIAPLEPGDTWTADHVAALLDRAREEQLDVVYGDALLRRADGPPVIVGQPGPAPGELVHGAALTSPRLAHLRYDELCALSGETGDWSLWRQASELGAAIGHLPRVVLVSDAAAAGDARVDTDAAARAILHGAAALYLDIAPVRVPATA